MFWTNITISLTLYRPRSVVHIGGWGQGRAYWSDCGEVMLPSIIFYWNNLYPLYPGSGQPEHSLIFLSLNHSHHSWTRSSSHTTTPPPSPPLHYIATCKRMDRQRRVLILPRRNHPCPCTGCLTWLWYEWTTRPPGNSLLLLLSSYWGCLWASRCHHRLTSC